MDFTLSYKDGNEYKKVFPTTVSEAVKGIENAIITNEVYLTIPVANNPVQVINRKTTKKQAQSPFTMELAESNPTPSTYRDYNTINAISVTETQIVIIRLGAMPKGQVRVKLRFEESGV